MTAERALQIAKAYQRRNYSERICIYENLKQRLDLEPGDYEKAIRQLAKLLRL